MMGKNFRHEDPSEHHPGCMKGMFNHFHNHTLNFARKRFPRRRITHRKRIAVEEDDLSSRPSHGSGESRETYDSAVAATVSEPGSVIRKSMRSRIKALISEEVSKRKGRHKRSTSCPPQTRKIRNITTHHLEPLDNSGVQVNESVTPRSSPKVQEVFTTPCACDLYAANDTSRHDSLEQSRLFLEALDLLNMRKELFLNVLRDPSSSLALQMHEKRLSESRVRLTKSMSFSCAKPLEEKDVNFKHESHVLPLGDIKFLREVKNTFSYASAGESNDQSMSFDVCSDEATQEQPQRQPMPTSNLSSVSPHHLNTGQDKVVIKRFKNLGEMIRHAIKDSSMEKQHIIKDAVLHKIPNDKMSKTCKGQGDTSEKPSKIYMKTNCEQKSFSRAASFSDSFERYNRLLESDPGREEKGKESERPKLRTTINPSPIANIPKKLNRIYSSPDLGLYHGLQSEEPLDFTCWETSITSVCKSGEVNVISGKQMFLESISNTENETQTDEISRCESQDNFIDSDEGLDAISECKISEGTGEFLDKGSKCEIQENIEDAGENLDRISKCESQENFVDDGEGLDKMPKSESQENFVDDGEGLDKMPKSESQENFVDAGELLDKTLEYDNRGNIEDAGEGSDRISKCETCENFVDAGDSLNRSLGCGSPVNIEDVNAGFDYTDDEKIRNSPSNIDLIADKPILDVAYDSSSQEDVTDPAKYNLPDDKLVVDHLLLDGEDSLVSQQHEMSRDGTVIYEIERGYSSTSISQVQVDKNSRLEFDYVKAVLDLSGFNRDEYLGTWHSPGQPVDPEVLDEVEGCLLVESESSEIEDKSCYHILLFDLVNEVLLDVYHKSSSYWPKALCLRSCIHPMPMGYHVLEEVWADINCYLRWKPTTDQAYVEDGDAVEQDLAKYDGWMNLQFDSECVGLELEELLFDDLIDELLLDIQTLQVT